MTFTPAARAYGVEPHKGVLLVGLPGCGKDLCKKIAAGDPRAGRCWTWTWAPSWARAAA